MRKLFTVLFITILSFHVNAQCWQTISKGNFHTMGIKTDGTLWTWGNNYFGQLGIGTQGTITINVPTQVGTSANWKDIKNGQQHTVAIKTDGTLWAWGFGGFGELGNGTFNSSPSPIQLFGMNWVSISVGAHHSMALDGSGTLWTWGINSFGQLGDGTLIMKNTPTPVALSQSISAGSDHSSIVKTDGTLWTWGRNHFGQLGNGTQGTVTVNVPTQVGTDINWKSVFLGGQSSLALKDDGTLWAWGDNFHGQLGNGTQGTVTVNVPTLINCPVIGIEEYSNSLNLFSIFPNPVTNILNIKTEGKSIDSFIIMDVLGRKVLEQKENTTQINIEGLPKGIYQLLITSEGKSYTSKFIKE